jgi:hypothetical protein
MGSKCGEVLFSPFDGYSMLTHVWDRQYLQDVPMRTEEEREEDQDVEMVELPPQDEEWQVPLHMIVKSQMPASAHQFVSSVSTSAPPMAPPPPPPPPPSPPSAAPPPPPSPPRFTNEEAALALGLEDYVRKKMLRNKYQPLHVHHIEKIPISEGVRKGKAKEERERKKKKKALPATALPVSTPISLPAPSSVSVPLRPIAPAPAPVPALAPAPAPEPLPGVATPRTISPTHPALLQAQVPAPVAPAPRSPSPIFLLPAPGVSPPPILKDEKDDGSVEEEKEKDDVGEETPTTILPPRRRVLESKARLACFFCRGRKIACKAAVTFGGPIATCKYVYFTFFTFSFFFFFFFLNLSFPL